MAEFNYRSTTAKELEKAYLEFIRLTKLEKELETQASRASTNSSVNGADDKNYTRIMSELRCKAEVIAKRRKTAKILTLIFSLVAMAVLWMCIFKGIISAIPFAVGLVVCIALFIICLVSDFGADSYAINGKLIRKHSSEIREAKKLDKIDNERRMEEKEEALEAKEKLKSVRAKLKCYESMKKDLNEFAEDMGSWNEWELDIDNYISRLGTSFQLKCINLNCSIKSELVDGHLIMVECWKEQIEKITNHQGCYSQCVLD